MSATIMRFGAIGVLVLPAVAAGAVVSFALLGPPPGRYQVTARNQAAGDSHASGVLQLTASNSEDFDVEELVSAAGGEIVINFSNDDVMPHDVAIDVPGSDLIGAPIARPGTTVRYQFATQHLPAGRYRFYCTLHPWMEGLLVLR